MNPNKKADLQRRLTLASVPKPPEGLAERIKREIPDHFAGQREDRNRLASSIAFNMRVAASILLLISSVYVGFRLLSPRYGLQKEAAAPALVPPATRNQTEELARANTGTMSTMTAAPAAPQQYARLDTEHDTPADARPADEGPVLARAGDQPTAIASTPRRDSASSLTYGSGVVQPATVPAPAPAPPAAQAPVSTAAIAKIANERAADVAASEAPAESDRRETARAEKREAAPMRAAAGSSVAETAPRQEVAFFDFVRPAQANELSLGERSEVFGVSTDRAAFARVKSTIERGERPTAKSVNVEAIVNYFAAPASRPPRGIRLEVEASPALSSGGRAYILRYTIDTPHQDVEPGGSVPPAASNAMVEIEFEPTVVSHHRIGSDRGLTATESTLLKNVSVTTLYEVQLPANAKPRTPVATVRLHYRDVHSGREQTITRLLRVGDISRSWASASRRHRLASLGAVWSESLRGAANTIDVTQRAEELANQNPHDTKARELADVANALRELSGTGSGR
ncbi:MAG: hypothetical protein JWN02_365 [Acidobacteria bacterium]|nr:hypothetical protein [Acidobacteriota bacterium]